MDEKNIFAEMMKTAILKNIFNALSEMGASETELKSLEAYKKVELPDIQVAVAWVAVWQQAKVIEATKDAYLEAKRQQETMKKEFEKQ